MSGRNGGAGPWWAGAEETPNGLPALPLENREPLGANRGERCWLGVGAGRSGGPQRICRRASGAGLRGDSRPFTGGWRRSGCARSDRTGWAVRPPQYPPGSTTTVSIRAAVCPAMGQSPRGTRRGLRGGASQAGSGADSSANAGERGGGRAGEVPLTVFGGAPTIPPR